MWIYDILNLHIESGVSPHKIIVNTVSEILLQNVHLPSADIAEKHRKLQLTLASSQFFISFKENLCEIWKAVRYWVELCSGNFLYYHVIRIRVVSYIWRCTIHIIALILTYVIVYIIYIYKIWYITWIYVVSWLER